MDFTVTDDAKEFILDHGGVVFVSPHAHRCCHGSITLLDTTITPGDDRDSYIPVGGDGIDVRFRGGPVQQPDHLIIELRGVVRRHLVSSWDGCAYRP